MKNSNDDILNKVQTPYEFYRAVRPEYFSDSHKVHKMSKEVFRNELSKLSADMKQDEFERFACRVVGRIVTPNIIPPTGPNGGGDGKVDFETFVVDDDISCKWYIAGGCRGNQRWAFAVSCKAKWEDKIKSDIENAISTGKHFDRFFFCTNQEVSSQKRLKIYNAVKEKYKIDTTIFDFNWFVDAVFDKGCYQIAIESLNLSSELNEIVEEGPLDVKRKAELKKIEERIQKHIRQKGIDTKYIDDLKRTAILARELELPRTEVEGRFYRAIHEAEKYGMSQQIFDIHYELGWTEFYWHENPEAMYEQYLEIKEMLRKEVNPNRIERVLNLLSLLRTASRIGLLSSTDIDIEKENKDWEELSQSIIDNPQLSTSALYAQILQLEMKLMSAMVKEEPIDDLLQELLTKINESLHHIDIDVESYSSLIRTLSPYIQSNSAFEEFVDKVAEIVREKDGDISFARVHFDRGVENLQKNDYVSAVKHLGQCIVGFQQERTYEELTRTCCYIAFAFEKIDLLNAAKVFLIRSLSLLLHEANTRGKIKDQLFGVLSVLCRLELRQGNLEGFLNWYMTFMQFLGAVPNSRNQQSYEELGQLDAILASLLLQSDVGSLPSQIPDVLKRIGLQLSGDMLLYQLGYEEQCSEAFSEIKGVSNEWYEQWKTMLPRDYFLFSLRDYTQDYVEIKTIVKGCAIEVRSKHDYKSRAYATLLLGLVESYFSTSEVADVSFITPKILLSIQNVEGAKAKLEASKKTYEYRITVDWGQAEEKELDEIAVNFLAHVLTRNALHHNQEEYLQRKEKQEKIGERLAVMANFMQDAENSRVFPYIPTLAEWIDEEDKAYPMKGSEKGTAPDEAKGKQANSIITDLIDIPVWDKAKWQGCAYLTYLDHSMPPIMIFLFRDIQYGKQIFEAWEESFSKKQLGLRISVITGVDKDHPTWYKVQVSPNVEEMVEDESIKQRYVMTITRHRRMEVVSDNNMQMFKREFELFKVAGITAAEIDENNQMSEDLAKRYPKVIPVQNIVYREAWTIGEHDVDMPAIQSSDNPIIPEEHKIDAPILKVLEKKRKMGL